MKTVEAKVIIITRYVQANETMAINKFQRSRLTFDLSAKVAHNGVPSMYIVFSETIRSIELKFYLMTTCDKLAKIDTNSSGDMTKMADIPIYGKNPLKSSSPEPEGL